MVVCMATVVPLLGPLSEMTGFGLHRSTGQPLSSSTLCYAPGWALARQPAGGANWRLGGGHHSDGEVALSTIYSTFPHPLTLPN